MKVCNCTLPTIHGADVCKNCANNNEYQFSDQFNENIAMIDRYFENITKTKLLDDLKNAGMKSNNIGESGEEYQEPILENGKLTVGDMVRIAKDCGIKVEEGDGNHYILDENGEPRIFDVFREFKPIRSKEEYNRKVNNSNSHGVEVRWFQPTNDAKDDGEMYCGNCDEYIDNECWRYCPKCGVRLLIHGRDIF